MSIEREIRNDRWMDGWIDIWIDRYMDRYMIDTQMHR